MQPVEIISLNLSFCLNVGLKNSVHSTAYAPIPLTTCEMFDKDQDFPVSVEFEM